MIDDRITALRVQYELNRGPARFLLSLYDAKGRMTCTTDLVEALGMTPKVIAVYAHAIRAILGREAVVSGYGYGYGLPPESIRLLTSLFEGEHARP